MPESLHASIKRSVEASGDVESNSIRGTDKDFLMTGKSRNLEKTKHIRYPLSKKSDGNHGGTCVCRVLT